MSAPNLSDAVEAALARLTQIEQSPTSLTRYKKLLALNDELRELRRAVCNRMNALPWNKEKKQLLVLREKLDRALSNSEYQIEVNISGKRLKQLEEQLSAGALNDSTWRKLQKERRTILALRRSIEQARTTGGGKSTVPAAKSATEKIAEYKALRARALRSRAE